MKYKKAPLSFQQQANLLISRGLEADVQELEEFLSRVNYYRFTGYLYPFRSSKGEKYESNTKFRIIKNIYDFDTELRLLTLAAISTI